MRLDNKEQEIEGQNGQRERETTIDGKPHSGDAPVHRAYRVGFPFGNLLPPIGPLILGGIAVFGFTAFVGLLLLTGRSVNLSTISVVLSLMLLGCIPGFIIILIAFSNRKKRVVICPFGVAFFLSRGFGSFYWRDVLKTTRQAGSKSSLTYTVYCHDGRQIVFTGLIGMYMLAETIDVQVARARHSAL